jgi:hypothetical protein
LAFIDNIGFPGEIYKCLDLAFGRWTDPCPHCLPYVSRISPTPARPFGNMQYAAVHRAVKWLTNLALQFAEFTGKYKPK